MVSRKAGFKKSGSEKAAQFLMVMGEDRAAGVLKQLSAGDVQTIGLEMARMGEMNTEDLNQILSTFLEESQSSETVNMVADEYTKKVLVRAFGEEDAGRVLEKIVSVENTRGIDSLKWMEPQVIAGIIQNEHPQIQAIVVSYLGPELSGDVLAFLPESSVVELIIRMAEMDSIDPSALNELNSSLEKQVEGVARKRGSEVDGVKNIASILSLLDKPFEESLMTKISDVSADIAAQIEEEMFVFDDLKKIPEKDFQLLLREVATDTLALALKGTDKILEDKVSRNMSSRAAEIFLEDMESLGPVKISDVEVAQKEILAVAKELSEAEKIVLSEDASTMVA